MKLNYKVGYFAAIIVTIIGLVLALYGVDDNRYIMIAGATGLALFGIYVFIKGFNKNYSARVWGGLVASFFILFLVALHLFYGAKIDYFIMAGLFLVRSLYEVSNENIETV